ncbi:MAG: hypothetical protein ACI4KM_11085 [Oscillospiraceae bacterium]
MHYCTEDLRALSWGETLSQRSTDGTYPKAIAGDRYYKMSMVSGNTVVGHESLNEVIVSRLLKALNIPHIEYELANALVEYNGADFATPLCYSREFIHRGNSAMTLENWIEAGGYNSPIEFFKRENLTEYLYQMLLVDFLIINRDRHGANLEILKTPQGIRLVPLFDNGLSFVAPCQNDLELIKAFEPMKNVQCNNFIGGYSLFENLKLIKEPVSVGALPEKEELFDGLYPFLTEIHIEKIYAIIKERFEYAEERNLLYVSSRG